MQILPISLVFIFFLFSINAQAKLYGQSNLIQAGSLVYAAPEKSLEIIANYLSREELKENTLYTLTPSGVKIPQDISISTVSAYLIKAKALAILKNEKAAWSALKYAQSLPKNQGISAASIDLIFTEAILQYSLNKDPEAAKILLEKAISTLERKSLLRTKNLDKLAFEALLFNAIIASNSNDEVYSMAQFERVRKEINHSPNMQYKVWYQIYLGKYFLRIRSYDRALSKLLSAYWLASENDFGLQIAKANLNLTRLYKEQKVLNKALEHANQAAEYYESAELHRGLYETQTLLGNIYYQQGRYNFALVHYFNALDIEKRLSYPIKTTGILVKIADTYLKMNRYILAEQYINKASYISQPSDIKDKQSTIYLLKGELALLTKKTDLAIEQLRKSLQFTTIQPPAAHTLKTLSLLSLAYENKGDYKNALDIQRHFDELKRKNENAAKNQQISFFKYQHGIIESRLQLVDMQEKQTDDAQEIIEQKKINLFLISCLSLILLLLLLRHRTANFCTKQLNDLKEKLYTHPRSGLKNLRMLNDKLTISLAKSSANFEQWYLGEIIHEPLSDKLSFAMFEVQFLKVVYLQHGYHQGLALERQLGDYLKSCISEPARLYHFSDAMFVYIEPSSETNNTPEKLAKKMQCLISEFIQKTTQKHLNEKLYIGMANYPFLPRAFTSINNKKLIDILLMATSAAKLASKETCSNEWVHLSAIDSTPAACFANTPVRQACFDNIMTGLIKVKTSAKNEINWHKVHDYDKH